MAQIIQERVEAPYVSRSKPRIYPRRFLLKWNNAHAKTTNSSKYIWHEAWGVLFPNGCVHLDYGQPYDSILALRSYLSGVGIHLIQWLDDEIGQPLVGTAHEEVEE